MREPEGNTAVVDKFGDTWIRFGGTWWPLTDGPVWDQWARNGVGQPRGWDQMSAYEPFTVADAERTARALERVRQEYSR